MRRLLIVPAIALIAVVALFEYRRYQIGDRELTKSELEGLLRHQHGLRDVALSEGPSWTYIGSGTDFRDTRYRFAIIQDDHSRTVHHYWEDTNRTNAGGDETTVRFSDPTPFYLALAGVYLAWVAIVAVRGNSVRVREPSVAAA
ncbi:MAG TPA: hypothetical protein VKD71_04920 [Gemmataceae bacterium]|nr:hypothetical protein [Gemmataceae bacterium]